MVNKECQAGGFLAAAVATSLQVECVAPALQTSRHIKTSHFRLRNRFPFSTPPSKPPSCRVFPSTQRTSSRPPQWPTSRLRVKRWRPCRHYHHHHHHHHHHPTRPSRRAPHVSRAPPEKGHALAGRAALKARRQICCLARSVDHKYLHFCCEAHALLRQL